jgi:hypothetical protein
MRISTLILWIMSGAFLLTPVVQAAEVEAKKGEARIAVGVKDMVPASVFEQSASRYAGLQFFEPVFDDVDTGQRCRS